MRETFFNNADPSRDPDYCLYRADGSFKQLLGEDYQDGRWTPSIHMPRWASRLTLKITNVRVERVQDISEEDAKDEGIFFTDYGIGKYAGQRPGWSHKKNDHQDQCLGSAKWGFASLWESIYNNWNDNPWVWIYNFKVIQANVDDVIRGMKV